MEGADPIVEPSTCAKLVGSGLRVVSLAITVRANTRMELAATAR